MLKNKKIIISIIIFFAILLFNKPAYAMTQEEAGQALANFAVDFYKNYGSETAYSYTYRANSYPGVRTSGYTDGSGQYVSEPFTDKYAFDCVGWISFAIHNCLGLGEESFTEFGIPPHNPSPGFSHGFELILGNYSNPVAIPEDELYSKARPGDLFLATGQHILLYVGDGYVVDSCGGVPTLLYRKIQGTGYGICAVGRITEDAAKGINKDNVGTMFQDSYLDGSFNYNGLTEGSYKGSYSSLSWLFDSILGFMDYLFGMLTYIIRAPFIGWTNIIELIINQTINSISGVEISRTTVEVPIDDTTTSVENNTDDSVESNNDNNEEEETTPIVKNGGYFIPSAAQMYNVEETRRINIEDLIYNRIPIFDVDIFDVDLSDYEGNERFTVSENSIIYKLRENVAIWYNIIRSFSIISLLLVLIYLGIRLAISTTAGDKAKYKSMLSAWVTSFIIIFFIHYFMIAVIEINDWLTNLIHESEIKYTGGLSMYDTIRTRAYSIKLSEGIPATIMYMVLVYFLVRFLYIYVKRYFTVNVLALMGPIMGVKFAIDKINKGKSGSMGSWMYDFAINVFLQSVHALLYTIFMAIAFEVGMQSIPGFILSLCILNFMFKAEDIFLGIFKFNDAKSLNDVRKHKNYFLEAYQVTKGVVFFPMVAFGLVKNTTKAVGDVVIGNVQIGAEFVNRRNWNAQRREAKRNGEEIPTYVPVNVHEKIKETLENVKNDAANKLDDKLYEKLGIRSLRLGLNRMKQSDPKKYHVVKESLDKNKKLKRQMMKRYITGTAKTIKTIATLTAGVPMMVVDPEAGFTMLYTNIDNIIELTAGKPHYGHRTKKQIKGKRGRVAAVLLAGTTGYGVNATIDNLQSWNKDRKAIMKNELMIDNLRRAHVLEERIGEQVLLIDSQLENNESLTEDSRNALEKDINKRKAEVLKSTLDSVIVGKNIKGVISDYMFKNRLEKVTRSDIDKILAELNLQNIKNEISALTAVESEIAELKARVETLTSYIENGIDEANNAIDRHQVEDEKGKTVKILSAKEKELKRLKVVKDVGEEISNSEELSEGLFIGKDAINKTVNEYIKENGKEELESTDVRNIVDLLKSKKDAMYSVTKEGMEEQFKKRDPKEKGLDKKETVGAMIAANYDKYRNANETNNSSDQYSVLSELLRDLATLNQASINEHGKSVTDMSKIKSIIKNNKK